MVGIGGQTEIKAALSLAGRTQEPILSVLLSLGCRVNPVRYKVIS